MSAVTGYDSTHYCWGFSPVHLASTWDEFRYSHYFFFYFFFKGPVCNYSHQGSLRENDRFSSATARHRQGFDFCRGVSSSIGKWTFLVFAFSPLLSLKVFKPWNKFDSFYTWMHRCRGGAMRPSYRRSSETTLRLAWSHHVTFLALGGCDTVRRTLTLGLSAPMWQD